MYNTKPNGKLDFYDEGKKFIKQEHGILMLIDNHDICVYSLTPKGEKSPKWLIVKVTQAGCMDRYHDDETEVPERCVVMEKMDYEKSSPMNLFSTVKELTYILRSNIKKTKKEAFYVENGLFEDELNANDFFSIEVDSKSKEPGAEIYLRDKEHFLRQE